MGSAFRGRVLRAATVLTIAPFILTSAPAAGEELFSQTREHFGAGIVIPSGSAQHSFAGNTQAFGLQFGAELGGGPLALLGKIRVDYLTGSNPFNDGGAARTLAFTSYGVDFGLGLKLFPIPAASSGFPLRPYFGATGDAGIAALKFSSTTLTALESSYSSLSLGYTLSAGIEAGPDRDSRRGFSFFGEIQLRNAHANLAGDSSFSLNCIRLIGGIGW